MQLEVSPCQKTLIFCPKANSIDIFLQALLDDPLYIGVPQKRVTGQLYDDLIDEFIGAATAR